MIIMLSSHDELDMCRTSLYLHEFLVLFLCKAQYTLPSGISLFNTEMKRRCVLFPFLILLACCALASQQDVRFCMPDFACQPASVMF